MDTYMDTYMDTRAGGEDGILFLAQNMLKPQ